MEKEEEGLIVVSILACPCLLSLLGVLGYVLKRGGGGRRAAVVAGGRRAAIELA